MHYHCEIIMPPTDNVEEAVTRIMAPFDENADEETRSSNQFWDYYVIGGRLSGTKLMARYDKAKIDEFYAWLQAEKVTVSSVRCGKQTLEPASQIPKVDAKWNEMFPPPSGRYAMACPIFDHASKQEYGDVCKLSEMPEGLTAKHVIIAHKKYSGEMEWNGPLTAGFMLQESMWNGCNHVEIDWDGTVKSALEKHVEHLKNYAQQYIESNTPTPDWLVVTVDYHS